MEITRRAPELTRALFMLVVGLTVALAAAVLFIWLAGEVWEGDVDRMDDTVLAWFVAHRTPLMTDFFTQVTSLGSRTDITILSAGLVGALFLARRPGAALAIAVSTVGSAYISYGLTLVFRRPRPPLDFRLTENSSYAFPSGHTIAAFTFFVTLALLAAGHVRGRALRVFLVTYAFAVGVLVAVSRLYVGAHYLSDVIGGALVGTAWAVTVVVAEHAWRHRRAMPRGIEKPA